jgi:DNA-binding SARP family transcriptional activator/tetratricopeptide (TPR) repeat protein
MEFRILGCLEAEFDGARVQLGGRRDQTVLAALLLSAGRVVSVRQLVDAVWDDDPPATAGKQVRNSISRLRQALGGTGADGLIVTDPAGYRLDAEELSVDALAFEAAVAAAGNAASDGRIGEAAAVLRTALAMWRGPALAGLTGRDLESAAAALDERRLSAQELYYAHELSLARHAEVLSELAGMVVRSPYREKLVGQYMVALHRSGRRADALAVYLRTRDLLADEMGLDPGSELRLLHRQILAEDAPAPPAAERPELLNGTLTTQAIRISQVRHSLPADTSAFTGRGMEMRQITARLASAAARGVLAVGAVDGMPGVGKTTLAVHVAHALAAEFPDWQMFIDLRAHTPGQEPMRPAEALAGLLASTGVDPRCLPDDLEGRAAMWRDRMAGQRALLVLDNAASSAQVVPLLPGGDCLVLVTSRRHLGDLPGAITPVLLDVLPAQDAQEMFTRLAPRAAADQPAVAQAVRLAGFLPLAISLLARVFAGHPSWTVTDLTSEMRAGLLTMAAENDSVAAAFEVSYQHLDRSEQRLFRLLGMHPGEVVDGHAAAALAGTGLRQAARLLDGLHREGLVTEAGHRRYGMHDLLRRYARDLAGTPAHAAGSRSGLDRLLDYYQHAAALAEARLAQQGRPGLAPAVRPKFEIPDLDDPGRALAWARIERANLLSSLDLATRTRQHARVVALTAGLAALLRRDGPWAEAVSRHAGAAGAARYLGDRLSEANALTDLGDAQQLAGDHPAATAVLTEALTMYRDLGDLRGEANALRSLGIVRRLTGDFPGAAQALEQALDIGRKVGDRLGVANSLRHLAAMRRLRGDYPGAVRFLEQALDLYRDLDDRLGEAHVLNDLGHGRQLTGDYAGAAQVMGEALGIYRDLGERLGQANALFYLGMVRQAKGDFPGAAEVLDEALGIYRDLGERLGEANVLLYLGTGMQVTGAYPGAAMALLDALGSYRDLGSRLGEANALSRLGAVRRLTGDFPAAAQAVQEAVSTYRDLGDRQGEADALNEQGLLYLVRGELADAKRCHQRALDLARQIGSSRDEASALAGLGRCALAAGQVTRADALLRQAHDIFRRIGAAEAHAVLAEPDALTGRSSDPLIPARDTG